MSTEQLEDFEQLARRAVACKHWRWMPGMVTETGIRVLRRDDDGYTIGYGPRTSYCIMEVTSDAIPDLSDPATLGCLLALVREAWGKPDLHARPEGRRWRMWSYEWPSSMLHPTEAEALAAALEAAPEAAENFEPEPEPEPEAIPACALGETLPLFT